MILLPLLAAAALGAPTGSPHGTPPALQSTLATSEATSEATAEGVEILRRLLAEGLDQAFQRSADESDPLTLRRDAREPHGLVTRLWARNETVEHSRAFHMPEVGLFFAFDAAIPVVTKEAKEQPGEGARPRDDEWERTRREVRGSATLSYRRMQIVGERQESELDPQAVEKVIDVVLQTAARHAGRVEGLAPQETLTIALRLSGQSRTWLHDGMLDGTGTSVQLEDEAPALTGQGAFSFVLATGVEAKPLNVVIRIALADLTAGGDAPRLRQRARINRY